MRFLLAIVLALSIVSSAQANEHMVEIDASSLEDATLLAHQWDVVRSTGEASEHTYKAALLSLADRMGREQRDVEEMARGYDLCINLDLFGRLVASIYIRRIPTE